MSMTNLLIPALALVLLASCASRQERVAAAAIREYVSEPTVFLLRSDGIRRIAGVNLVDSRPTSLPRDAAYLEIEIGSRSIDISMFTLDTETGGIRGIGIGAEVFERDGDIEFQEIEEGHRYSQGGPP